MYKRIIFFIVGAFLLFLLLNLLFPLPGKPSWSTIILDDKEQVLHAFLTPDQQWRMKTDLDEISPLLRKTIVHKEDRWFYYHPGVNPYAIARALVKNIFHMKRTSGASTITMQVARALEPKRRTYFNKIIEMFRALQLEWKYSKDEILQLYLNLVPLGGNIQGVKSAAVLYFQKNPDHLSLAEITALSIIPNRPSSLVIGKNNAEIITERNKWLHRFAKDELFTAKEIEDALQEPLTAVRHSVPRLAPHFSLKMKKRGEDIVQTHLQTNTQLKTEKLVHDYTRALYLKNIHNAAVIIIDNATHNIITYVGSADFYDVTDGGQVNGAAAIRQPGSTLKPLLYGMCVDEGLMTPKSRMNDVAVNYDGYSPENYDKQFNGSVTMQYALEHSLNIPAVKSLQVLGKDRFVQQLAARQFQQIKKDQAKLGLSMILGGCGATLEELTALYTLFAQDGKFIKPSFTNNDRSKKDKSVRVLSAAATFMINEALSKVNRPDFPINWQATERMPKIAWKTGTSYGRRDAWSIGYNKRFTVGVWVGNFSGTGVPDLSGANVATPLLFKIFNTIDYDSDEAWFQQPADCDLRKVCTETGMTPGEYCTDQVTDYFIPLISSSQTCNHVQEIMVSANEKMSYCPVCAPATGYKKKLYKTIGSDLQAWMEEHKIVYQKIPPHNPACEKVFKEGAPLIISPRNGGEYFLSKKDPEPLQLRSQSGSDVARVYWYINNKFYKSAAAGDKIFFLPDEGPVKISCSDDKGRNRDIWIKVRCIDL